jgi:hypothetical protein
MAKSGQRKAHSLQPLHFPGRKAGFAPLSQTRALRAQKAAQMPQDLHQSLIESSTFFTECTPF